MTNETGLSRRNALGTVVTAASAGAGAVPAASAVDTKGKQTMRVYEIGDYKNKKAIDLQMVTRPVPVPGHGEVVMKIYATGLNARDFSVMRGTFRGPQPTTRIPLSDNAGVIAAVGPGVTRVKVGDRVTMTHYWRWIDGKWDFSMSQEDYAGNLDGFLAEMALVPAEPILKIPDSMSFEDACTLQSAGITAWRAVVVDGNTRPNDFVLTLGTGGVSVFALQWAKMLGARVAITSSSDEKLARMKTLGADITANYRTNPNWHEEILAKTGNRGVDVAVNTVGMGELEKCLLSCASNGRVMYVGASAIPGSDNQSAGIRSLPNMIMKDLTIKGIVVGSRRMMEDMVVAMSVNGIKPVIDKVFTFEQAMDAVRYYETGAKIGKVVIKVA